MPKTFRDHFSPVANHYFNNRPTYPPALFDWLANRCKTQDLAWDCATGNGQAACELGRMFKHVVATDASSAQVDLGMPHPHVRYRVAPAEHSGLDANSVDLLVVAQALHWFDLESFHAEARRVLKSSGILAILSYGVLHVEGETVNALIQQFYHNHIGPYWPPERRHVENGYRDLPFPFHPIAAPPFVMKTQWNMQQLLGYFRSWSATNRYIKATGIDPVTALETRLHPCWGCPTQPRIVEWPLALQAGTP